MLFTTENHQVWQTLFARQLPNIEQFACKLFISGLHILNPNPNRIPSPTSLNRKIAPLTGWKVVNTRVRYLNQRQWFTFLSHHHSPITTFIRTKQELDFTPEPDIFHDLFGHQPYMVFPEFTELFDMFTKAYFKAKTQEQIELIGKLAWFSYEFGLIPEDGQLKAFGAGLMSSFSEIHNTSSPGIPKQKFTIENILATTRLSGDHNPKLFVIQSLPALKSELTRFFDTL